MRLTRTILCAAALLGLAACGDDLGEQAILGAGAGAGTAAVLNGDLITGAALGAAGNIAYCRQYPGRCR